MGDSMEPRIFNGDLVLARKSKIAESGDIVICVNDGEALIKKIKMNGEYILISLNSKYEPFIASRDNFRVVGLVRGIFSRKIG